MFSKDSRYDHRRRRHLLNHEVYETPGRTFFKGQLFSSLLNWADLQDQLEELDRTETHISLPVSGEVLASRVRITIAAGLVDVNRLLKEATVRRHIVIELIRMRRQMGHPDYGKVDMRSVIKKAKELTPSNEPTIPSGLVEILEAPDTTTEKPFQALTRLTHPRKD